MLSIDSSALAAIRQYAESGYPFEICGFLVGGLDDGNRIAREAWPVRNAWEDEPGRRAEMLTAMERPGGASAESWQAHSEERRFLVAPQDIVACMRRARVAGLDLVGVYHTHPDHPAVPSEFDRAAAWPEWSYLIVSVVDGRVAGMRSWVVEDDGPFVEEQISAPD